MTAGFTLVKPADPVSSVSTPYKGNPTEHFTILEPQNPGIGVYVYTSICWLPDLEAEMFGHAFKCYKYFLV